MILYADWSSMALVLALVSPHGLVVDVRESKADGAASTREGDHAAKLALLAGDWLGVAEAIYVSGMATARGNWRDTGYIAAPAHYARLLAGGVHAGYIEGVGVTLLPGLSVSGKFHDVMRGEEVRVWGLGGAGESLVILPGKHSKWVAMERGVIRHFATFLTGEICALLLKDSIISRLLPPGAASTEAGFDLGLDAAMKVHGLGGGALRSAFTARSAVLIGDMTPDALPGYLEGLLIAAEIEEARSEFLVGVGMVELVGEPEFCAKYARALQRAEVSSSFKGGLDLGAMTIAKIHQLQKNETHAHIAEQ